MHRKDLSVKTILKNGVNIMNAPDTSADFDQAYSLPFTFWGDVRIPREIKSLLLEGNPRSSLELGCGIGRFTRYMAKQGLHAVGVDFSQVAIEKAKNRISWDEFQPEFFVGDVTNLDMLKSRFDVSFDVGCFHCLSAEAQKGYVSEVFRLLKPGSIHLIWALDDSPAGDSLSPEAIRDIFAPGFELQNAKKSRRRIISSHWYWLERSEG
jgi:SAM-dependent methyltransferase